MALRTNRLNAQAYASCIFAGGTEAWAVKRLYLLKNIYADDGGSISNKSGIPNGYNTGAMLLPLKPGGMSSYNPDLLKLVKFDADAKMGRNLEASAAMTVAVVNAQADQIISMEASASLAVASSDAALSAGVQMEASASLSVSTDFSLGGIIPVTATASAQVSPDVSISALAFMEAEAGGPTPLSPEGLARAVWSEDTSEYTDEGTFGEKLNSLSGGGGGGPTASQIADAVWDEAISAHLTSGSAGKFINDLAVELDKRLKTTVFLANR